MPTLRLDITLIDEVDDYGEKTYNAGKPLKGCRMQEMSRNMIGPKGDNVKTDGVLISPTDINESQLFSFRGYLWQVMNRLDSLGSYFQYMVKKVRPLT